MFKQSVNKQSTAKRAASVSSLSRLGNHPNQLVRIGFEAAMLAIFLLGVAAAMLPAQPSAEPMQPAQFSSVGSPVAPAVTTVRG